MLTGSDSDESADDDHFIPLVLPSNVLLLARRLWQELNLNNDGFTYSEEDRCLERTSIYEAPPASSARIIQTFQIGTVDDLEQKNKTLYFLRFHGIDAAAPRHSDTSSTNVIVPTADENSLRYPCKDRLLEPTTAGLQVVQRRTKSEVDTSTLILEATIAGRGSFNLMPTPSKVLRWQAYDSGLRVGWLFISISAPWNGDDHQDISFLSDVGHFFRKTAARLAAWHWDRRAKLITYIHTLAAFQFEIAWLGARNLAGQEEDETEVRIGSIYMDGDCRSESMFLGALAMKDINHLQKLVAGPEFKIPWKKCKQKLFPHTRAWFEARISSALYLVNREISNWNAGTDRHKHLCRIEVVAKRLRNLVSFPPKPLSKAVGENESAPTVFMHSDLSDSSLLVGWNFQKMACGDISTFHLLSVPFWSCVGLMPNWRLLDAPKIAYQSIYKPNLLLIQEYRSKMEERMRKSGTEELAWPAESALDKWNLMSEFDFAIFVCSEAVVTCLSDDPERETLDGTVDISEFEVDDKLKNSTHGMFHISVWEEEIHAWCDYVEGGAKDSDIEKRYCFSKRWPHGMGLRSFR
ncbi:hypothetical protein BJ508DRAFT_365596 [Ascobolus immersus RN42]|uniref:Uncharacterized protein n=1 Tax=Ascobolus immersus RN42 TaxID=1160509 RepID=A0A3N4HPD6_ASCIM|nr:hypothetical protein BJ508DRAFT_365596 [Ascobolus immersus RN42]